MKSLLALIALALLALPALAGDNELTAREKAEDWILLFDGRTLDGWMTSSGKPSRTPVEDGCINPHKCGGYMMVHKEPWENYKDHPVKGYLGLQDHGAPCWFKNIKIKPLK